MTDIGFIVFGITGLLALTSLLPALAQRLKLPYSVLLALAGSALGLLVAARGEMPEGFMGTDFLNALSSFHISSEAFLVIFLPTLLFETALAIDVRRMLNDLAPILVMAVIAVVVCMLVVGFTLASLTDYGLIACLMLGAIIATTDPAAVVGIFREIGAPQRLTMLVEGESLLNDAAAIALFSMLAGMLLAGQEAAWGGVAIDFLVKFVGGAAIGGAMGLIVCYVFPLLKGFTTAEITLTVALAYLSFFVGEHYFHVSGVVACVAAGLVVGSLGRTRMSPRTHEQMEGAWGQLGFWANSLIFLLAAMLVPEIMRRTSWAEIGLTIALYLAALVARIIVVGGLLPLLTAIGIAEHVNNRMKVVVVWGGLRGAISLALALAVVEQPSATDSFRDFIATSVTGYVLMTLFINGTTLRLLIHWLKLDRLSVLDRGLRDRALSLAIEEIDQEVRAIGRREGLAAAAIDMITTRYAMQLNHFRRLRAGHGDLMLDELLSVGLAMLSAQEEVRYFKNFRDGIMPRRIAATLLNDAGRLREAARFMGRAGYAEAAHQTLRHDWRMNLGIWLNHQLGFEWLLADALAERCETMLNRRLVIGELLAFCRDRLTALLGEETAIEIRGLILERTRAIDEALTALRLQYPDFARELQSRYLGRIARQMETARYDEWKERAIVGGEVADALARDRDQRWADLDKQGRLDVALSATELVERVPLFAKLESDKRASIARLLKPRMTLPGDPIVRRGQRGDAMYFIASGAAVVLIPGKPVELGSGEFFGELALLTGQPRNADVVSLGYCRLLELSSGDFQDLLKGDADLKRAIEAVAAERMHPHRAETRSERADRQVGR
ncbi:MAG TPA: cation:proton antiporter [Dongiaceae bacterium]|jgi:CPA1 family monovalent cation:H+ antiporter|nr:cation:proton antiporter [Dongiaceae bacterium]